MIFDHLSLSKMRSTMSLTVTMETEPIERAQSSHADLAKVCVWKTQRDQLLHLSHLYVLHATMKSMCFLGVFSTEKQTLVQKAGEIFM